MPEREPSAENDPFLDDLRRYMYDVYALEADGKADVDNNRIRLSSAFYDLLEKLGVPDTVALEKLNTMLPTAPADELAFSELVLQYKLAPLRLLSQRQSNPPLPLERITPRRVEMSFNFSLADDKGRHSGCSTGEDLAILACDHNLTCPKRLGYAVGADLLWMFMAQRRLREDDIDIEQDPAFFNLAQLERTLLVNKIMRPADIKAIADSSEVFIDRELFHLKPPKPPRTNDETNEK